MADRTLRELERRLQQGDPDARASLTHERLRSHDQPCPAPARCVRCHVEEHNYGAHCGQCEDPDSCSNCGYCSVCEKSQKGLTFTHDRCVYCAGFGCVLRPAIELAAACGEPIARSVLDLVYSPGDRVRWWKQKDDSSPRFWYSGRILERTASGPEQWRIQQDEKRGPLDRPRDMPPMTWLCSEDCMSPERWGDGLLVEKWIRVLNLWDHETMALAATAAGRLAAIEIQAPRAQRRVLDACWRYLEHHRARDRKSLERVAAGTGAGPYDGPTWVAAPMLLALGMTAGDPMELLQEGFNSLMLDVYSRDPPEPGALPGPPEEELEASVGAEVRRVVAEAAWKRFEERACR